MISINAKLEKYIFEEMGAYYCADPEGAGTNLNNDEDNNKQYLGTYFPRSFVESYKIYDNIFSNDDIFNSFNKRDNIGILDIGSGTGGNLFGLLNVLVNRFKKKTINVYSFDGNGIALRYQRELLKNSNNFFILNGNTINLTTYTVEFKDKADLQEKIDRLNFDNKLDIVHSFKFVNEFYNSDYQKNKGMYVELIEGGEKWLRDNGILLLLDITNCIKNGTFASIIMNNECREYFKEKRPKIKYILPICCALWHKRCSYNKCFSKKEFHITHRQVCNDITKVNFKLFMKDPLASQIISCIEPTYCYAVASRTYCTEEDYKYNCNPPSDVVNDPFIL